MMLVCEAFARCKLFLATYDQDRDMTAVTLVKMEASTLLELLHMMWLVFEMCARYLPCLGDIYA